MISTENVSAVDRIDGERNTVERDRALRRDEAGSAAGTRNDQPRHLGQVFAGDEFGNAVDMAADHMAAEFVAKAQRAFEVELGAGCQVPAVVIRSVSAAASTAK